MINNKTYKLVKNQFDENAGFDGFLFETYGNEIKFVLDKVNQNRIISIIEGDDNELYYSSGYHLVNRIGYLITDEPIIDNFDVLID